jgi:hypothetical protein
MSASVFSTTTRPTDRTYEGPLAWTVLFWGQGLFYLLTGLWPLVSIETFQMVTGPKTDHLVTGRESDHWLVMTAGVLITSIGVCLLTAAYRRSASPEAVVQAIGAAIGLTAIDIIYVSREVIAPIYLLDAGIEIALIAAWLVVLMLGRRQD